MIFHHPDRHGRATGFSPCQEVLFLKMTLNFINVQNYRIFRRYQDIQLRDITVPAKP